MGALRRPGRPRLGPRLRSLPAPAGLPLLFSHATELLYLSFGPLILVLSFFIKIGASGLCCEQGAATVVALPSPDQFLCNSSDFLSSTGTRLDVSIQRRRRGLPLSGPRFPHQLLLPRQVILGLGT